MDKLKNFDLAKLSKSQIRMQSEGAEFLVLGQLLVRHINAAKAYTNFPEWDILAFDSATGKQAKVQVKSMYSRDSSSILLKNLEFDFLVLVRLNKGVRYTKPTKSKSLTSFSSDNYLKDEPQFWIVPVLAIQALVKNSNKSKKYNEWTVTLSKIEDYVIYENAWNLIGDFVRGERNASKENTENYKSNSQKYLNFAGSYNGYLGISDDTHELEKIYKGFEMNFIETKNIPKSLGIDFLRGWLFYLYRFDHFMGGMDWEAFDRGEIGSFEDNWRVFLWKRLVEEIELKSNGTLNVEI